MVEVRPTAEQLQGRHVKIIRTASWEEFEAEIKKFEDPTRKCKRRSNNRSLKRPGIPVAPE